MYNDYMKILVQIFAMIFVIYFTRKITDKIDRPGLDKIKPAIAMQGAVVLWYGIIILHALIISHFHLFTAILMNITHTLFIVGGLVWLIRRPSVEPMIILLVFQIAGIIMNYTALFHFALEDESSMIIISIFLRTAAIYYLFKAIHKIKAS